MQLLALPVEHSEALSRRRRSKMTAHIRVGELLFPRLRRRERASFASPAGKGIEKTAALRFKQTNNK